MKQVIISMLYMELALNKLWDVNYVYQSVSRTKYLLFLMLSGSVVYIYSITEDERFKKTEKATEKLKEIL